LSHWREFCATGWLTAMNYRIPTGVSEEAGPRVNAIADIWDGGGRRIALNAADEIQALQPTRNKREQTIGLFPPRCACVTAGLFGGCQDGYVSVLNRLRSQLALNVPRTQLIRLFQAFTLQSSQKVAIAIFVKYQRGFLARARRPFL